MILFKLNLTTLNLASFLEAAGVEVKIGLSLKLNHHKEIYIACLSPSNAL